MFFLLAIVVVAAAGQKYNVSVDKFILNPAWPAVQANTWNQPDYYIDGEERRSDVKKSMASDIKKYGAFPAAINYTTKEETPVKVFCAIDKKSGGVMHLYQFNYTIPLALQWFGNVDFTYSFRYVPYMDTFCMVFYQDTTLIEDPPTLYTADRCFNYSIQNGSDANANRTNTKYISNTLINPTQFVFTNNTGLLNVTKPATYSFRVIVPATNYTGVALKSNAYGQFVTDMTISEVSCEARQPSTDIYLEDWVLVRDTSQNNDNNAKNTSVSSILTTYLLFICCLFNFVY